MLKVVLIDDEPLVIEGLLEMVKWQQYGFKVTGVAEDGMSGLKLILETGPDLVVTDIRMPELDGLTMIEQCQKQLNKEVSFLVLSGYNEFDYIKTAMDLKSLSYILKPIDVDEIHTELERIQKHFEHIQTKAKRLNDNINVLTQLTLKRILEEPYKQSLVERAEFLLDFKESTGFCFAAFNNRKDVLLPEGYVNDFFEKEPDLRGLKYITINVSGCFYYVLIYGDLKLLNVLTTAVETNRREFFPIQIDAFVISRPQQDLKKLNIIGNQIKRRIDLSFYDCIELEILNEDQILDFSKNMLLLDLSMLLEKLRTADFVDTEHALQMMLRKVRQAKLDPHLLTARWDYFIKNISDEYKLNITSVEFTNYCEFKEVIHKTFVELHQHLGESEDQTITKIKTYLENHIQEDLRLKRVATVFGYNPVYFGQLFLKETGQKYNEYIAKLRIGKAKGMLLNTDLSIKEIATQVGYNNPDYFLLKFKEIEGILPSHYRT